MEKSIKKALALGRAGEIDYPTFINLLAEAGVIDYTTDIPSHTITYRWVSGETMIEEVPSPGTGSFEIAEAFDESALKTAIASLRTQEIDFSTFLLKIARAGVETYDVDIRERKVFYKGIRPAYVEDIPDRDD